MMRDIRNKIDEDIAEMSFEEEKEYFRRGSQHYTKSVNLVKDK